jgi:hypothetical protein
MTTDTLMLFKTWSGIRILDPLDEQLASASSCIYAGVKDIFQHAVKYK